MITVYLLGVFVVFIVATIGTEVLSDFDEYDSFAAAIFLAAFWPITLVGTVVIAVLLACVAAAWQLYRGVLWLTRRAL